MTAAETPPAEPPARRRRISFGLVGQAGAVVGLIAAVVGLLFTFFPGLRPGSDSKAAPVTALDVGEVAARVPLREYLVAERIDPGSFSAAALRHLGAMATVHFEASGFGKKQLHLDVALSNADTGETACAHRYDVGAGSQTIRAWMAFPDGTAAARATYNLHVSLFDPDGKPPPLRAVDHSGIPGPGTDAGPLGPVSALC